MSSQPITNEKCRREGAVTENFLDGPNEASFAELFNTFTPQLVAFYLARSCELSLAEDLTQEVMLTVYCKAGQVRDRALFHAWLFKIARNALCRHYGKQAREVATVELDDATDHIPSAISKPAGTPGFEFRNWMAYLDSHEREIMTLRFIEQWEYHEIAAARGTPVGTVQWQIFNAKKKLATYLASAHAEYAQDCLRAPVGDPKCQRLHYWISQ